MSTTTARIIVSLAQATSMPGRSGFAARRPLSPAISRTRVSAAGTVRPHRHDAAAGRRLVGTDLRELARRRERRRHVVADALDERLGAEHRARPLPVLSIVRPATSAP